jgi:hypothetical protein
VLYVATVLTLFLKPVKRTKSPAAASTQPAATSS